MPVPGNGSSTLRRTEQIARQQHETAEQRSERAERVLRNLQEHRDSGEPLTAESEAYLRAYAMAVESAGGDDLAAGTSREDAVASLRAYSERLRNQRGWRPPAPPSGLTATGSSSLTTFTQGRVSTGDLVRVNGQYQFERCSGSEAQKLREAAGVVIAVNGSEATVHLFEPPPPGSTDTQVRLHRFQQRARILEARDRVSDLTRQQRVLLDAMQAGLISNQTALSQLGQEYAGEVADAPKPEEEPSPKKPAGKPATIDRGRKILRRKKP